MQRRQLTRRRVLKSTDTSISVPLTSSFHLLLEQEVNGILKQWSWQAGGPWHSEAIELTSRRSMEFWSNRADKQEVHGILKQWSWQAGGQWNSEAMELTNYIRKRITSINLEPFETISFSKNFHRSPERQCPGVSEHIPKWHIFQISESHSIRHYFNIILKQ